MMRGSFCFRGGGGVLLARWVSKNMLLGDTLPQPRPMIFPFHKACLFRRLGETRRQAAYACCVCCACGAVFAWKGSCAGRCGLDCCVVALWLDVVCECVAPCSCPACRRALCRRKGHLSELLVGANVSKWSFNFHWFMEGDVKFS